MIFTYSEFKHTEEVTSEDHFATFIADLLFAGSSTTANQLLWVLLFLLKNPDCMEKVREELNTLKGNISKEAYEFKRLLAFCKKFAKFYVFSPDDYSALFFVILKRRIKLL